MRPRGPGAAPTPERGELRVGRRTVERRPAGERWRDIRGLGAVVLFLGAATVLIVLAAAQLLAPAVGLTPAARGGVDQLGRPITVDVPIENVISKLPDGRVARGAFYLRMREEAAPEQLVQLARATRPTPTAEPGPRSAGPITGASAEARAREAGKERLKNAVRDAVNGALPEAPVEQVYLKEYIVQ